MTQVSELSMVQSSFSGWRLKQIAREKSGEASGQPLNRELNMAACRMSLSLGSLSPLFSRSLAKSRSKGPNVPRAPASAPLARTRYLLASGSQKLVAKCKNRNLPWIIRLFSVGSVFDFWYCFVIAVPRRAWQQRYSKHVSSNSTVAPSRLRWPVTWLLKMYYSKIPTQEPDI